jgi:tetratricopeptide (TPR) repeat protein
MNRNDIIRVIHDTGSLNSQKVEEVKGLLKLYPYFQSAHLLLLKGLHDASDIQFESQLKDSALFLADREVLYYLLKREPQPVEEHLTTVTPADINEPYETESDQTVIESVKNSEELITELEKIIPPLHEEEDIDAGLASSGLTRSLLITEESDEDDSVNIVFLLDDEEESNPERITYMDPSIQLPATGDLLELDLQEEVSVSSGQSLTSSNTPEIIEKYSRKQEQTDLIDKFIIANPRIEQVRDKSFHPVEDISKPFAEEKGGFITETLAKIYVSQGYYSKAIDIYEKLSLKFPEKSSYFATQIEKVKELIK